MKYLKELITGILSAFGGYIVFSLGGLDTLLKALLFFIGLDYVTGVLGACATKSLASRVGFLGIVRKVLLLAVVAVAYTVQKIVGDIFPLREMVLLFFIANEGLSILENGTKVGIEYPDKLKDVLVQLKKDKKEKEEWNDFWD